MNKLGAVIVKHCEGSVTKKEMDKILARYSIYGEVYDRVFAGYDYENQAWIEVHLGCKEKTWKD